MEKLSAELRPEQYASLAEVLDHVSDTHGPLSAFSCFGHSLTYREIDELSSRFAGFLRNRLQMNPGDRIAIQLPNLLQFPVVVYAAIKADLVIVTTNPLYTAPEMKHQFRDSGAKAVVVLEAFCDKPRKRHRRYRHRTRRYRPFRRLAAGTKESAGQLGRKTLAENDPGLQIARSAFLPPGGPARTRSGSRRQGRERTPP